LLKSLSYIWRDSDIYIFFLLLPVCGVDEGVDSEGEDTVAPMVCQLIHRTPAAKIVDIRRHLSVAPSEYSYFRADTLEMWAGPSHWKIKPFKGPV